MKLKQYEVKFKVSLRPSNKEDYELPEKVYLRGFLQEAFRGETNEGGVIKSIKVKEL